MPPVALVPVNVGSDDSYSARSVARSVGSDGGVGLGTAWNSFTAPTWASAAWISKERSEDVYEIITRGEMRDENDVQLVWACIPLVHEDRDPGHSLYHKDTIQLCI